MKYYSILLFILLIPQNNLYSQHKTEIYAVVTNKSGMKIYDTLSLSAKVITTIPAGTFIEVMGWEIKENSIYFDKVYWNNFEGYCNTKDYLSVAFYVILIDMPKNLLNEYHIGSECVGCTNSEWKGSIIFEPKKNKCTYKEIDYLLGSNYKSQTIIMKGLYKLYKEYISVTFTEFMEIKEPLDELKNLKLLKMIKTINKSYKLYPAKSYCHGKEYFNNFYAPDFKGPNLIFGMECK